MLDQIGCHEWENLNLIGEEIVWFPKFDTVNQLFSLTCIETARVKIQI